MPKISWPDSETPPRGREIGWLQCAVDEGTFHLLTPQNAIEECEYLTLEVVQERTDEACILEIKLGQTRISRNKGEIRLSALRTLADAGGIHPAEVEGFRSGIVRDTERIEELDQKIELKEAMIEHLRASITTPKYRNADPDVLRHIHWDA